MTKTVRFPIIVGQTVNPVKIKRAKELRQNMTEAEKVLWQAIRANRLNGWHFRRQQIIGGFIIDFYCHAAALAVEVDGDIHDGQKVMDRERDELLRGYGVEVVRFSNDRVITQLPRVLQEIDTLCRQRTI
jgi:very-short-patch-repair endonuclease